MSNHQIEPIFNNDVTKRQQVLYDSKLVQLYFFIIFS